MAIEEDIELLAKVQLLSGCDHDQLRLLAFGAEARALAAGTKLYERGAFSDAGYVVARGEIELTSGHQGRIISTHQEGSLIAQMALITETRHAANAVASRDSEVLKIPRQLFRRILREYPELAQHIHDHIQKSVTDFTKQLDQVRDRLEQTAASS